MRVKCLAQEHNAMTRPGLEPGPLDPESTALTTRSPRLSQDAVRLLLFSSAFLCESKEKGASARRLELSLGR